MRRWVLLGIFVFALIVFAADTGRLRPLQWIRSLPMADKVGHFVIYGSLNLVGMLALAEANTARISKAAPALSSVVVALLAVLEEASQVWVPTRNPSLWDLLAGLVGILAAIPVAMRLGRARGRPA